MVTGLNLLNVGTSVLAPQTERWIINPSMSAPRRLHCKQKTPVIMDVSTARMDHLTKSCRGGFCRECSVMGRDVDPSKHET